MELINLKQEQDLVAVYYTKQKIIWEELNDLRLICSYRKCKCRGFQNIITFTQMGYCTMGFLMGLNDN